MLLIQPDHLGDVLLASPAATLLREALPEVRFEYLVGPWSADVARHGPLGEAVRTVSYAGFTRRAKASAIEPYTLLLRTAWRLRRERFDAAIVLRPDHWWGALLALAAGIPVRIGFDVTETSPVLTHRLPFQADRHAAERALDLARFALGLFGATGGTAPAGPTFATTPDEEASAERWLSGHGLDAPVVVQPGAGAPLKSWPVARWAELSDALAGDGWPVMLSGGPDEGPLVSAVAAGMSSAPAATLVGQPLGQVAAIFRHCAAVVGPDGGALHLAAAVGTPTVRLYGPASMSIFGPWPPDPRQRVLATDSLACVPCGDLVDPPCGATVEPPCMLALGVAEVLATVRAVAAAERGVPTATRT